MSKKYLLRFLLLVAFSLAVFLVGANHFSRRLERNLVAATEADQALDAPRIAANMEAYLQSVARTVNAVLSLPATADRALLSRRFAALRSIYPEIVSLLLVTEHGKVFTTDRDGHINAPALSLADVYEGAALLGAEPARPHDGVSVQITHLLRFIPELDRVRQVPVVLFSKAVEGPAALRGNLLVPYQLDFAIESFISTVATGSGRHAALLSPTGEVVSSSLPIPPYSRALPWFAPAAEAPVQAQLQAATLPQDSRAAAIRALTRGSAFFTPFRLVEPDTGHPGAALFYGRFVPVQIGGRTWTLVLANSAEQVLEARHTILLPALTGSLVLVVTIAVFAVLAFARFRRDERQNTRFQAAVAQSATGIAVLDRERRVLFANPAYLEITGANPDRVLGTSLEMRRNSLAQPDRMDDILAHLGRREHWEGEIRFRRERADGDEEWREIHLSVAPVQLDRRPAGYVMGMHDVSAETEVRRQLEVAKQELEEDIAARERAENEKEALQQQLRRSQTLEAVGQLAGGVAHDFNNILGSVLGCLYVVQRHSGDRAEIGQEVERIKELCKRGGDLTRQLLAVGRRGGGESGRVEMGELLAGVGLLLKRTLPRSITLSVEAPRQLPAVVGHRSSLLISFLNLGLNARDAMPDGGQLKIRARMDPEFGDHGGVVVEVADTGVGIPREMQERVFEPFFTTKSLGAGTGLGLATCQAAVHDCGGEISLDSVPHRGTTFTLRLPVLEDAAEEALPLPLPGPRRPPITGQQILVVEDEVKIRQMVCGALRGEGYRVLEATTGLQALEVLRDNQDAIAALVLDYVLPEMDGAGVYRLLRQLEPGLPVLFITGREDLAAAAAEDCPQLPKPFSAEALLDAVEQLLQPPQEQAGQSAPEVAAR